MANTTFTDQSSVIYSSWLQDINNHVYLDAPWGSSSYVHYGNYIGLANIPGLPYTDVQNAIAWLVSHIGGTGTLYPFNTIAAMRANSASISGGQLAYVLGYHSSGDGGEGMFYMNSTDFTSTDNGGTIIVDAAGNRWYRLLSSQPASVRHFGAYGDGSHDDTTAIQNAVTAVKTVMFPAGTYLVSSSITMGSNTSLIGESVDSVTVSTSSASAAVFSPAANSYYTIQGITFNSTTTRTNSGTGYIYGANSAKEGHIYDCNFFGVGTYGIVTTDTYTVIRDCYFASGYSYSTAIQLSNYGGKVVVDSSEVLSSSGFGNGISISACQQLTISNCAIQSCTYGINIAPGAYTAGDVQIHDTWVGNCVSAGVNIAPGSSGQVIGVKFVNCLTIQTTSGPGVLINAGSGVVNDVQFINHNSLQNSAHGIYLISGTEIHIRNSLCSGNSGSGIYFTAPISNMSIINCRCGNTDTLTGNTYGLTLTSGTFSGAQIVHNNFLGNITNNVAVSGTITATNSAFYGNLGLATANNPFTSVTVTASPFTYTNTLPYPSMFAVTGGTVSSITVAGTVVATGTNVSFPVPPYANVVITYSSAPTVSNTPLLQ